MIGPAFRTVLLCAVALLVPAGVLRAHIPEKLVIDLRLDEDSWEATSEMDVKFAVVALMQHYLPPDTGSGWIENLNDAQLGLVKDLTEKLYRERFQLAVDGQPVEMSVRFPDYETQPLEFPPGENEEPVVRVVMKGRYPAEGGPLTVKWSARWGPTLALIVRSSGDDVAPVLLAGLGETLELDAHPGGMSPSEAPNGIFAWVRLGFERLLVRGPLHLLFLMGLLLLVRRGRSLLGQVLCFTVAHSLALWAALLGSFEVPAGIVAPFLAIGIVYIGIENLFLKQPGPWRLGMVFGLGLVHGLAFARALQDFPLAREDLLVPSAGFHLGIELAQIVIIAGALVFALPFLKRRVFSRVRVLGSVVVVAVGLFWAVELLV